MHKKRAGDDAYPLGRRLTLAFPKRHPDANVPVVIENMFRAEGFDQWSKLESSGLGSWGGLIFPVP
jgi:hypothetical protein